MTAASSPHAPFPGDAAAAQVEEARKYNATVHRILRHSPTLATFRIVLDEPPPPFVAGQYTTLGLGDWEPAARDLNFDPSSDPAAVGDDGPPPSAGRLIKRAYSLTSSLVDESGAWLDWRTCGWWEFLVERVGGRPEAFPTLTPRLFALREGARIFVDRRPTGRYTTQRVPALSNVVFLATGAVEAPHALMIEDLLARGHAGRVLHVVCARNRGELVHEAGHRALERRFKNYRFVGLTTDEPEAGVASAARTAGDGMLQELWIAGEVERWAGVRLTAADAHVFLCGNPRMIVGSDETKGLLPTLVERGWRLDSARSQGNVHLETYW